MNPSESDDLREQASRAVQLAKRINAMNEQAPPSYLPRKKKRSWLTTLFGWLSGIGTIVAIASPDPATKVIAGGIAAGAQAAMGTAARDNRVSSEDAGAK